MYKNTFKKPKSQLYFSSLSLTRKTQDWITHNFSLIRLYFSSYFSSYTALGLFGITLLLPHITRIHMSARTHTHIYRYTYVHACVCVLLYQVSSWDSKYNLYSVNYYDWIGLGWALWACGKIQATLTNLHLGLNWSSYISKFLYRLHISP